MEICFRKKNQGDVAVWPPPSSGSRTTTVFELNPEGLQETVRPKNLKSFLSHHTFNPLGNPARVSESDFMMYLESDRFSSQQLLPLWNRLPLSLLWSPPLTHVFPVCCPLASRITCEDWVTHTPSLACTNLDVGILWRRGLLSTRNHLLPLSLRIKWPRFSKAHFPASLAACFGHVVKYWPVGGKQKWHEQFLACALQRKRVVLSFSFLLVLLAGTWTHVVVSQLPPWGRWQTLGSGEITRKTVSDLRRALDCLPSDCCLREELLYYLTHSCLELSAKMMCGTAGPFH